MTKLRVQTQETELAPKMRELEEVAARGAMRSIGIKTEALETFDAQEVRD
jgi:hypothetical protein